MDKYSNLEFKKIISQESYYTVFTNIKLYEKEDNVIIRSHADFLRSSCILILLITDNIFVEIYSKNEDVLKTIHENAKKNRLHDISYITENNFKRKEISAYSD